MASPVPHSEDADKDFKARLTCAPSLPEPVRVTHGWRGGGVVPAQPQCLVSVTLALAYFRSGQAPTQRVSEERPRSRAWLA